MAALRDPSVAGVIHQLSRLLEQVAAEQGAVLERVRLRRAIEDAAQATESSPQQNWALWCSNAAASVGLSAKILHARLAESLDLVRDGAHVILYGQDSIEQPLALVRSNGRRVTVLSSDGEAKRESISHSVLAQRLAASPHDRLPMVVLMPSAQMIAGKDHDAGAGDKSPWRRLRSMLRPEWSDIWIVLLFAFFVGVLALATPIAVEALVNTVAFGRLLQPIVVLSLVLFAFLMFAAAMRGLQTFVVEIIQRRLFARVAADLAHRLPRVHPKGLEHSYGPELVNRFFDVVTLQKVSASLLLEGLAIVLGTAIGMAVLAFYHPWLLGFDLFLLILIAITILVLGRGAIPSAIDESKHKYYLAGWLEDVARCQNTFKLQGGPEFAAERANHLVSQYLLARRRHFKILLRQILFALTMQAVGSTVLLGLGGWLVIQGQLTLGQLVAAELIVTAILGSFAKLGKHLESFYDLLAAVDKLGILFDLPLESSHGANLPQNRSAVGVRLRDLHFQNNGAGKVFDHLNLEIKPGQRVAVTGPPGSGKSTLLDLIYGIKQPTAGQLELGHRDAADLQLWALRGEVALVRGVEIVSGTIEENVDLRREGIAASDVRAALSDVGLLDELLTLPARLSTKLTSDGKPLTDSQQASLMIARALAGAPRLLMIDSTLDSLPTEALEEVLAGLSERSEQMTMLIVSSRTEVLAACDQVVELPVGKLARLPVDLPLPTE